MGKYRQLAKNTALIGLGSFASKVLTFLCVPLYTALLTTEQYGIADVITTTSMLVFQVLTLSVSEGLMRYCLEENSDKSSLFSASMLITFAGFVPLAMLLPVAQNIEAIANNYLLFLAYYIGYTLYTTMSYFARGIEEITVSSICGVIDTVLTIALNILFLVVYHFGLSGYIAAYAISFIVSTIILFVAIKGYRYCCPIRDIDPAPVKELVRYSVPMIPNGIGWWISNSAGLYFVVAVYGASASGIYSAAQKIPAVIYALGGIFLTAWRISAVKGFGSEESKEFYANILQGIIAFSSILTAALIVLVKPISTVMFASDFQEAWRYVPLLGVAVYYHSLDEFFGSVYTSAMKTKMLFASAVVGAVANVALCAVLVPTLGLDGATIAALVSYASIYAFRDFHTEHFFPFPRFRIEQALCTTLLIVSALAMTHLDALGIAVSIMALIAIVIINHSTLKLFARALSSLLSARRNSNR